MTVNEQWRKPIQKWANASRGTFPQKVAGGLDGLPPPILFAFSDEAAPERAVFHGLETTSMYVVDKLPQSPPFKV